ncbi:MAG: HAD-IIIA family hydrolase [Sulfurospirillaceae bacterium]|nr:HAD-IIIA family hydrolase [Sulfurospirillaceae bacterium]MCK9545772.1 HAD-IIIA family hydrolase [Sulfurospirillaceae bacterium]NLN00046.1 HAD-IIIA family hydrolase [Campylobacteraceae bacterium]
MIKLLVLDVDGCLTDGKIYYTNSGDEIKAFNVKDGLAINAWIKSGKKVAIITGRESKIVKKRADELRVDYLFQGVKDKLATLEKILEKENILLDEVAAIGDDLNDLKLLKAVKWAFAPKDAASKVLECVHTTLSSCGGKGAVREMIDRIFEKENFNMEDLWL